MNTVYLGIGGNIGNRILNLKVCIENLSKKLNCILCISNVYETDAWGNTMQAKFLNQAVLIKTNFNVETILNIILDIEKKMGRVRNAKWDARIIDIDILFFNNEIINLKNLHIPHPYIQERKFVLQPLLDINPNFIHPQLQKTIQQLYLDCKDSLEVVKVFEN